MCTLKVIFYIYIYIYVCTMSAFHTVKWYSFCNMAISM